ncbi:MAG: hypothetical protein AVDCRST_MAG07-2845, partial [uncultured Frankineae bacterium]
VALDARRPHRAGQGPGPGGRRRHQGLRRRPAARPRQGRAARDLARPPAAPHAHRRADRPVVGRPAARPHRR